MILFLYLHFALGLLDDSDLNVLVEELGALHNKWRALGEALPALSEKKLDFIGTQHSPTGKYLQEMLRMWINTVTIPTWQHVLGALRMVGEADVADNLKVKYGESATTVISLILLA